MTSKGDRVKHITSILCIYEREKRAANYNSQQGYPVASLAIGLVDVTFKEYIIKRDSAMINRRMIE